MADFIRAEGSSRKRQKTSRHDAGPALKRHLSDSAATGEGSSSMAQKRAHSQSHSQQTQAQPQSRRDKCHHEAALKTLHSDVSAMRDLVTCQVCHRFMYEPFQLSCGHTYCYTCLSQWLGSNRKKTCPDCRSHIHQQPTPSYIIRELVLIFVSRTQLLPDGETAEEHHKMAQEEAALVAKDKANKDNKIGGLFKGIFNRSAHGHPMPVLRDAIDGVDRCPACHWEVEDGYCNQCGLPVGEGFSDFDEDESDDDDLSAEELDEDIMPHDDMGAFGLDGGADVFGMEDDDNMDIDPAVFNAAFGGPPPFRLDRDRLDRLNAYSPINIDTDGSSDSETDDDENNSEMDDFIDDDVSHTGATYDDSSDNTEVQIITSRPGARRAVSAVVISDDEGTRAAREQAISVEDSSSEDSDDDDDDDDVPVAVINRRNKHIRQPLPNRRRPITVDSEDESSSDESDGEVHQPLTNASTARGSSPTASNSATNDDDEEEDDDDDTSTRYGSEAPSSVAGTYNRDLDSSEVDDDEEEDRWDVRQVFPPLPPSLRDPRNRLQTRQQTRPRTVDTPVSARHLLSPIGVAARQDRAPPSAAAPIPGRGLFATVAAPAPAERSHFRLDARPFNLGNTLRAINGRGDRQGYDIAGYRRQPSEARETMEMAFQAGDPPSRPKLGAGRTQGAESRSAVASGPRIGVTEQSVRRRMPATGQGVRVGGLDWAEPAALQHAYGLR